MKLMYVFIVAIIVISLTTYFCLYAKKLQIGSSAPDFSLVGNDNKTYTLSQIKSDRIVLYFYPRDNTPGCTKQACGIAQDYTQLQEHGIEIFGINYQSPIVHRAFKKEHNLPFVLLSDTKKKVAHAYGAFSPWHPMFPKRITIVIEKGKIISILESIDVNNHVNQILKAFNVT